MLEFLKKFCEVEEMKSIRHQKSVSKSPKLIIALPDENEDDKLLNDVGCISRGFTVRLQLIMPFVVFRLSTR